MNGPLTRAGVSRRSFIKGTGSAAASLLLGFHVAPRARGVEAAPTAARLNAFLRVDPDNTITLLMNHSEFGNGAYTSLTMMVAEELDAAWDAIALEEAPTRPEYYSPIFGEYLTAGSVTTGGSWLPMRTAGAQARAMFLEAAARSWGAETAALSTRDSQVYWAQGGRQASYGELVAAIHSLDIQPPAQVALKDPADFAILGKPRRRFEGRSKVDGSAVFGGARFRF